MTFSLKLLRHISAKLCYGDAIIPLYFDFSVNGCHKICKSVMRYADTEKHTRHLAKNIRHIF